MSFTGSAEPITATLLGGKSKMYLVPTANIGANNAAAVVHASMAEVMLSSKHMCDPGPTAVTVPGLQATGGMDFSVSGIPEPKIGFTLSAIPKTAELAAELNTFREAWINGTPLWLLLLNAAKTVPGAFGMMGSWLLTAKEKRDENNQLISYEFEGTPSSTWTHLPQAYEVPTS